MTGGEKRAGPLTLLSPAGEEGERGLGRGGVTAQKLQVA